MKLGEKNLTQTSRGWQGAQAPSKGRSHERAEDNSEIQRKVAEMWREAGNP